MRSKRIPTWNTVIICAKILFVSFFSPRFSSRSNTVRGRDHRKKERKKEKSEHFRVIKRTVTAAKWTKDEREIKSTQQNVFRLQGSYGSPWLRKTIARWSESSPRMFFAEVKPRRIKVEDFCNTIFCKSAFFNWWIFKVVSSEVTLHLLSWQNSFCEDTTSMINFIQCNDWQNRLQHCSFSGVHIKAIPLATPLLVSLPFLQSSSGSLDPRVSNLRLACFPRPQEWRPLVSAIFVAGKVLEKKSPVRRRVVTNTASRSENVTLATICYESVTSLSVPQAVPAADADLFGLSYAPVRTTAAMRFWLQCRSFELQIVWV